LLATLQVVTGSGASVSIGARAGRGEQSLQQIPRFQFKLDGLNGFRRPHAAMLSRGRRWYAIAAILLLATPLVVGMIEPDDPAMILKEGRNPWPAPRLRSFTDWLWFPRCLDAYLTDHFGLRQAMIHLYRDVTDPITRPPAVLIGRGGRMFYLGDEMVKQSAGHVRRDAKVAEVADLLANMRVVLSRRGIAFLVAVPPNSSTIDQDDLPRWARNPGRKTEYDLLLSDLAERGVKAVDLRPALKAARSQGAVYLRYDSHWTPRGAIAGYNAVIEGDGRPDWRIDPATVLGPPAIRKGGDVARIAGVQDEVTEMVEGMTLSTKGADETISADVMPDHVVATGLPGKTIMVIGDSFTHSYFTVMLSQHAGRVIWIHHHHCGFDWRLIDKFHPDEVWWAPTERFLICNPHTRPINFPDPMVSSRPDG
jgi:alginate O-acetyltransferase complex protein AlgJ